MPNDNNYNPRGHPLKSRNSGEALRFGGQRNTRMPPIYEGLVDNDSILFRGESTPPILDPSAPENHEIRAFRSNNSDHSSFSEGSISSPLLSASVIETEPSDNVDTPVSGGGLVPIVDAAEPSDHDSTGSFENIQAERAMPGALLDCSDHDSTGNFERLEIPEEQNLPVTTSETDGNLPITDDMLKDLE